MVYVWAAWRRQGCCAGPNAVTLAVRGPRSRGRAEPLGLTQQQAISQRRASAWQARRGICCVLDKTYHSRQPCSNKCASHSWLRVQQGWFTPAAAAVPRVTGGAMGRHDLGACPSSSWGRHTSSAAARKHHRCMWLHGLCVSCTAERAEDVARAGYAHSAPPSCGLPHFFSCSACMT